MHNLELKAVDRDPDRTLAAALAFADDHGVLHQRDTYFATDDGRLKLREQDGQPAQLIAYSRPDDASERRSDYTITEVDPAAVTEGRTVIAVVVKRRRLLMYKNVRIHLDDVDGLGRFVELEAVGGGEEAIAFVRGRLGIRDEDLLGGSYGDSTILSASRRAKIS
jgi:adenylate cyclase class IV